MLKCAGYIRVSTNHIEQKTSLRNQEIQIKQFIDEKNYSLYKIYSDICSGIKGERANFTKLLKAIKNKEFDLLIVKDLSRLTRNTTTAAKIKSLLIENDIKIITIDYGINTLNNPESINKFVVMVEAFENESRSTSNRVKTSRKSKSKEGLFIGSIPPFGYYLDKGKLFVKSDESPKIVIRIFDSFIKGESFASIARSLNEDSVLTPSVRANKLNLSPTWRDTTIRKILTNIHYCGHLQQCKTTLKDITLSSRYNNPENEYITIRDTHEAIISEEDFFIVQNKISNRKMYRPKPSTHLYSNLFFCSNCGNKMHFRKEKNKPSYYICGTYNKKGASHCSRHKIFSDDLTHLILSDIKYLMSSINSTSIINDITKYLEEELLSIKNKYDIALKTIVALEHKKKCAYDDKCDGILSVNEYKNYTADYNKKINKLREDINVYKLRLNNRCDIELSILLENIQHEFLTAKDLDVELLNRLIERIEVDDKSNVKVFYRFSN